MDRFTAMILVVLVGITACMGVLMLDPGTEDEPDGFHIEYVVGDATGSNPNPSEYVGGEGLELMPMAYQDGLANDANLQKLFGGWYLDPGFEQLCMTIPADATGDKVLYAKWQDDAIGRSVTLSFEGTVRDGILNSYTMTGQQVITYRFTSPEYAGYYMTYDTTTTYDHGFNQYTTSDSTGGWNIGDDEEVPEPIGYETIDTIYGPKNCTVYGDANSRQWIGNDDAMIYRLVVESRGLFSSKSIDYRLSSSTIVPIVNEIDVTGYADNGITVSGSGVYMPTDTIKMTAEAAEGTTFVGWFDAHGKLLTESSTLTMEAGWSDIEVYALNDVDPDYTTETFRVTTIDLGTGMPDPTWSIYRYGTDSSLVEGTSDILSYTFEDTGLYEIYIDSGDYHGYRTLEIAGDVVRTFDWRFDGKPYTLTLTMDYDDVQKYRDMLPDKRYGYYVYGVFDADHARQFVTYKDPYIQQLANEMNRMSAGMSDRDRADFVLAFLQDIEYQSDEVYMGAEEYWKYPLETLYDKGGDCEDSSILYCSIVKAMGYDTALFLLPGHMMSGIAVDGRVSGSSVVSAEDGKRYYYVETTSDDARIGQKSAGTGTPSEVVLIY